ncbi:SGNH/GDSL hydrolase family protein [Sporolactobacillus terrae]|uniref:GDSL family lipase n=1 Tax=Sporolactobacillus terrae TaxID=269673 RepID=A0ABX5Q748_9BACL|nr:SGNH/GDSL hydrolase family protein [Sporolactobacillus terrae]QAA22476.1 GDSL family lipase [Sporolactobacillus terrae]QAA25450.1 GDSL family lipase [Sporolactobacillus terrae]UAK17260.1 SGNH/GDSL hydrolase family protein [Sporolactobacillus terrae]
MAAAVIFGYIALRPSAAPKKPKPILYKITALGDSLTEGVGDLENQGYVGAAAEMLKKEKNVKSVSVSDLGHRGDTSADLLKKLKQPKYRKAIKASNTIFLTIGGNDIVHVFRQNFLDLHAGDFNKEQTIFSTKLKQVLKEIRQLNPDASVYYFGLYNPFEDYLGEANEDFVPILAKWNANSKQISENYQPISFIPTSDLFRNKSKQLLSKDHFHPNREGYNKMAKRLIEEIVKKQTKK